MTQPADLIIDNGTIVTEALTFAASLAIRDGRIAAIGAAGEMPNTDPPVDTVEHYQLKLGLAAPKSHCDFGIYALLGEHNLDQLEPLAEAGAIGFKLFLGNTTGARIHIAQESTSLSLPYIRFYKQREADLVLVGVSPVPAAG